MHFHSKQLFSQPIDMERITEEKLYRLEALADKVSEEQRAGKKIVFTNGCFDLLHTGHTRYLREARACGDKLIIAVNSDESVRALKGEKRPIIPLEERMEMLAGFYFVDYVVSFSDLTPLQTIEILKPDILVKGGDWPLDKVVGKDFVESKGGKVMTIPEIPGASTTNIVETILDRYSR